MRHKPLKILLGIECALCLLSGLLRGLLPTLFTSLMAFPFEQIGLGLRALSLSGTLGNLLAWALYVLLSLLPLAGLLRKDRVPEDGLLALLSGLLLLALYGMINPTQMTVGGLALPDAAFITLQKAILGGGLYAVLLGYLVLRLLRRFRQADLTGLHRALSALLWMGCAALIGAALGGELPSLGGAKGALQILMQCLMYLDHALPHLLDVWVLLAAIDLTDALQGGRYTESAVQAADRLSKRCVRALTLTVSLSLLTNTLQMLLMRQLREVHLTVEWPIFSIALALLALIFARYVRELKRLRDESELFI